MTFQALTLGMETRISDLASMNPGKLTRGCRLIAIRMRVKSTRHYLNEEKIKLLRKKA